MDFGEALVVIAGAEQKAQYLAMNLPHSDDCFVVAFQAETTEAFLEGHVRAFAYFGGVPTRILYDNTRIAVAKILGGEERRLGDYGNLKFAWEVYNVTNTDRFDVPNQQIQLSSGTLGVSNTL